MPKAMAGDPVAQDRIGAFYDYGFLEQNYSLAALWYRRAARQGNADAEYNLALLYLNGSGVTEDDHEGLSLLEAASRRNHPSASRTLGEALIHGYYGLKVDEEHGWQLIHRAADAGSVRAQMLWACQEKGAACEAGQRRAAKFGDLDALRALALRYNGTPEAALFQRKAAEGGDTFSMGMLGCEILRASHTDKERQAGLRWLGSAIDLGDPNSVLAIWSLDVRHLIKLPPAQRAFLYAILYDQEARLDIDYVAGGTEIPYFVAAIFNLPPDLRDQARELRSDYRQRKITFEDLQVMPDSAAPPEDWMKSCEIINHR